MPFHRLSTVFFLDMPPLTTTLIKCSSNETASNTLDWDFKSCQIASFSSMRSPWAPGFTLTEMANTFLVWVPSMTNKKPSRSPYMTRDSLSNWRPKSVAILYKYSGFIYPPTFSGKLELFPIQFTFYHRRSKKDIYIRIHPSFICVTFSSISQHECQMCQF